MGTELAKVVAMIGKKVMWKVEGMKVPVEIMDIKVAYGKVRYLIKSEFGGEKWVDGDRIYEIGTNVAKTAFEVVKEFFIP